jgi:hypothetical protein
MGPQLTSPHRCKCQRLQLKLLAYHCLGASQDAAWGPPVVPGTDMGAGEVHAVVLQTSCMVTLVPLIEK